MIATKKFLHDIPCRSKGCLVHVRYRIQARTNFFQPWLPAVDLCDEEFHLRCCRGPRPDLAKGKTSRTEHMLSNLYMTLIDTSAVINKDELERATS